MAEPTMLGSSGLGSGAGPASSPRPTPPPRAGAVPRGAERTVVRVAGFWRRALAGLVDAAVVVPAWLVITWVVFALVGLSLPEAPGLAVDVWLDHALTGDPALWGAAGLGFAVLAVYLLVFQIVLARTLGMRVLGLEIIDVYGDRPSAARAALRTGGWFAGLATLGLGFVWAGFDAEKRALHDWIAGTYVVFARTPPSGGRR